jgi:cell division protease FtsH
MPRGEAGGVTFFQPRRRTRSLRCTPKSTFFLKLGLPLGGRAAEELIYGKGGVTTGASSDYAMVYQIAREMVTTYGFGKHFYDYRNMSEDASAFIDEEIDLLVGDCYEETLAILRSKMTQLEQLKGKLIEEEIVDGQWVYELMFRL